MSVAPDLGGVRTTGLCTTFCFSIFREAGTAFGFQYLRESFVFYISTFANVARFASNSISAADTRIS